MHRHVLVREDRILTIAGHKNPTWMALVISLLFLEVSDEKVLCSHMLIVQGVGGLQAVFPWWHV